MPTREELHRLVDSLPEEALKTASDVLSRLQTLPPPPPAHLETFLSRREKEHIQTMLGKGRIGSFFELPTPRVGSKLTPTSGWEGHIVIVNTHRHYGQSLTVIERIRIDEDRRLLIYKHEVTGNDKSDEREIEFDLVR